MTSPINTTIAERSIGTNVSTGEAHVQTGVTPQGARFEVLQTAPSILTKPDVDADSLEELSIAISEKKEQEVKRIAAGPKSAMVTANVAQVQQFMEHMRKNYSMDKLEALAKRILQRASSAGQMLQMVQEEFEDAASQYMVMQFVATYSGERGDSQEKQEMAKEALARLEEDYGDEILTAINASSEGYVYGKTAEQVQQFVKGYKDAVLNSKTLSDILNTVLSLLHPSDSVESGLIGAEGGVKDNEKAYLDVINHLIKALGNDMEAVRPSREPEKLQVILQDLYRLQLLNSLLENCRLFAQGMAKYFDLNSVSSTKLMQDVVSITADHWVGSSRFTNMPPQYEIRPITLKVIFTKGIINILKEVPLTVFESLDTRNNLINAAKEALEAFIAEEEDAEFNDVEE